MTNELALQAAPQMPPVEVDATPVVVDLAQQRAWVEAVRDLYLDLDVSKVDAAQAKRERASLNTFAKQIASYRVDVKRRNEARVAGLLDDLKAMEDAVKEASGVMDRKVKEAEAAELESRRQALREAYEVFAPILVPVVSFETLAAGEKWLNKTYGQAKAVEDMQAKVSGIARAWDMLKSDGLEADALRVAERTLFSTLDYGKARAEADAYRRERERIEALKAQVEPEPEPEPPRQYRPEPVPPRPVQPRQAMPEPQQEATGDWVIALRGVTAREARAVIDAAVEAVGTTRAHVFEGTLRQAYIAERMG